MDRIQHALTVKGKKAFVPYVMAGDGGLNSLKEKVLFLQKCGADAVEIGIPFSDPVADGPTIQRAGIRALKEGTTVKKVLGTLHAFKNDVQIPVIIMTYLNPIIAYGIDDFASDAEKAGVAGCIIPDLPLEEEILLTNVFEKSKISLIRLVTLTTPAERIKEITKDGTGFVYAVTVTGITGVKNDFSEELSHFLKTVKESSPVPVLAGFGVSNSQQIEEVCKYCDGVIVGSKIIELFEKGNLDEIEKLIKSIDSVRI